MTRVLFCVGTVVLTLGLAGCATYHPLALSSRPNLARSLAQLDLELPAKNGGLPKRLNPTKPLTPDQVGLVAVLNNPRLAALNGRLAVANANLLAAHLLPNPSVALTYAFLVSGPAEANAYTAVISQDIRSIITYRSRVEEATARARQISARSLWQEWQVAQKARLLAIDINSRDREIQLRQQALSLLSKEVKAVRQATEAGNLTLAAEAPLLTAEASAQSALAAAKLQRLKDWQKLDALLGLQPLARFAIRAAAPARLPNEIESLITSMPARRPDLVALRLGYDAAEADVRTAILDQFPAFSLGIAGGSDTSRVVTMGPQVTFVLPVFNHNQAMIASTQATRLKLHAEYQARLDEADGMTRSLLARVRTVSADLKTAHHAAVAAEALLSGARHAYHQGDLDQRSLVDYETTALHRKLEVVRYRRTLEEDSLALVVELGLGLPQTLVSPVSAAASRI